MIIHTGEALIDFIPTVESDGGAAYRPVPGGSPYNTAVATARLGVPNGFLGKISRDFFGDQLVSHLLENGVGTDHILRDDRLSTLAFVKRSEKGEARYAFFCENAADRALRSDELPQLSDEVRAIQFGSISLIPDPVGATIVSLVQREKNRRVVSFDPNIRENIVVDTEAYRRRLREACQASTIVKISDEDLSWFLPDTANTREGARSIIAEGTRLVVVTSGANGASAYTSSSEVAVPAKKVNVVDTIGAGDSFHGGLLAWLYHENLLHLDAIKNLTEDHLRRMLRFAGAVSAGTCARAGNDPPRLEEINCADR